MASPSTKIVLKETTKMTLHERFSIYRQNNLLAPATPIRQTMAMQRQASIKNQRLAVQMANRPSVVAALKIKKRSLKQRLGMNGNAVNQRYQSNVKARLALGARIGLRNRLGNNQQNLRNGRGKFQRGGHVRPGTSPMLKARLGINQNVYQDNRNLSRMGSAMSIRTGQQSRQSNRGNMKRGRGFNRNTNNRQLIQQNIQNMGGRNRIGRGRWQNRQIRGRGRGGNQPFKLPTKQDLDNDIDQYMAQTKNHLDAELDAYMAQTE